MPQSPYKYQNDISKATLAKSILSMRKYELKEQKVIKSESATKMLMSLCC